MARANVAFAKYETNIFKLLFLQKLGIITSADFKRYFTVKGTALKNVPVGDGGFMPYGR